MSLKIDIYCFNIEIFKITMPDTMYIIEIYWMINIIIDWFCKLVKIYGYELDQLLMGLKISHFTLQWSNSHNS